MPRDLVKLYSFVAGTRSISVDEQIPFKSSDVRLIINETKHEIICSSMQKENITVSGSVITFASKFSTLDLHDEITIEIDFRLSEIVPVVPESPTTHKVIFLDPFGVVNEQWVEHGTNAIVPSPNEYEYLIFAEWNQDTTNITSDKIIGATYDTLLGKTYAKIRLTNVSGLSPMLYLNKSDNSTLTVDWGDSTTSTFTNRGNFNTGAHNYSVAGDYVITMWISVGSGTYSFGNGSESATFVGGSTQTYRNTLLSLFIGNSVTSIRTYAFIYCYSLTSVSIPNSVTSIGINAFAYCYPLLEYKIYATTPPTLASTNTFTGINSICKIYVPDASLTAYKTATNWSTYANYIYPLSDIGE